MTWTADQKWESEWHGNCVNSYWEETKQRVYASKMGLESDMVAGKNPVYDLKGITVLDMGGGPYSMLLKCINFKEALVVDPCDYPQWTSDRYASAGIKVVKSTGEDFITDGFYDEVWIYNCLQHTIDPEKIIKNIRSYSKIIRIFEWIETGIAIGHPQNLTEKKLNEWLGGIGKVEALDENGCHGNAYYGIFKGNHYAKV